MTNIYIYNIKIPSFKQTLKILFQFVSSSSSLYSPLHNNKLTIQ